MLPRPEHRWGCASVGSRLTGALKLRERRFRGVSQLARDYENTKCRQFRSRNWPRLRSPAPLPGPHPRTRAVVEIFGDLVPSGVVEAKPATAQMAVTGFDAAQTRSAERQRRTRAIRVSPVCKLSRPDPRVLEEDSEGTIR